MTSDPLSIVDAARDAGERPAIITSDRILDFAACARLATAAHADDYLAADPSAATVLAIYAALQAHRPLALLHPDHLARPRPSLPAGAALVLFTSGSTAEPRGVVHTRASLLAATRAHPLPWQDDDRWLLCLSLAHAGGAAIVIRCLAARRPIVLHDGTFDAARVAKLAHTTHVTLASFVPTQLEALIEHAPFPSLRAALVGGAHAPSALLDRAARAQFPVLPTYGMTETFGQIATSLAPDAPLRPLRDVDIAGGTAATPARLTIRGPMLASRYLDGEPIAPCFTTSDLGVVDADGTVHVCGRADEVIVSGGKKVHPGAIEGVLLTTPGVRAACAFGLADARWGEVVAVALAVDSTFDRDAATTSWHAQLPAHARPRQLAFAETLPMLPSGKIDRRAARRLPVRPVSYRGSRA